MLPFLAISEIGKKAASVLWNRRLSDLAREWLTTDDGRAGVRPLGSTRIGTGGRFF